VPIRRAKVDRMFANNEPFFPLKCLFKMNYRTIVQVCTIAFLLVGCTVANPRKYYTKAYEKRPYDVVIVPGTPFVNGQWDRVTHGRLLWAKFLYDRGVTKHIICSGAAVYSPYVEAEIMRKYAIAIGVPAADVFAEPIAEHSTENLYYGWKLARSLGFEKIGLATDEFQSKMLKKFNRKMQRKVGSEVDIIPMVRDSVEIMDQRTPEIDPSSAFRKDFVSIVDRQTFWQRFQGTLGKYIVWEEDGTVGRGVTLQQ